MRDITKFCFCLFGSGKKNEGDEECTKTQKKSDQDCISRTEGR